MEWSSPVRWVNSVHGVSLIVMPRGDPSAGSPTTSYDFHRKNPPRAAEESHAKSSGHAQGDQRSGTLDLRGEVRKVPIAKRKVPVQRRTTSGRGSKPSKHLKSSISGWKGATVPKTHPNQSTTCTGPRSSTPFQYHFYQTSQNKTVHKRHINTLHSLKETQKLFDKNLKSS